MASGPSSPGSILWAPAVTPKQPAVLGVRTLLPLNLHVQAWIDSDGGARGSLEKSLPLTPRLNVTGAVRYDTHDLWEGQAGLDYTLSRDVSLLARWHSTYGFGGGVEMRF